MLKVGYCPIKYLLLSSIISAPVLADATTPAADSTTEKQTNNTIITLQDNKTVLPAAFVDNEEGSVV